MNSLWCVVHFNNGFNVICIKKSRSFKQVTAENKVISISPYHSSSILSLILYFSVKVDLIRNCVKMIQCLTVLI